MAIAKAADFAVVRIFSSGCLHVAFKRNKTVMSSTETGFRESVRHARERWQDGRQVLRHVHDENAPGNQIVHSISDLQDHVLLDLYKAAMAELPPGIQSQIALVLHLSLIHI